MDLMTRIGGRKFLIAVASIGTAVYLEIAGKGLTPTMAGFLVSIVGLFHAANYASSTAYMVNKKSANADPDLRDKIEDLHETVKTGFAPEKTDDLRQLLVNINTGVASAATISGQTGQMMLNLTQVLQQLSQRK